VKRKILEERPDFDEAELGFGKFSKFLAQAEEHGVVRTVRGEGGLDVSLPDEAKPTTAVPAAEHPPQPSLEPREEDLEREAARQPIATGPTVIDVQPTEGEGHGLGPRRGSTRRRGADELPPLFEGQVATAESPGAQATANQSAPAEGAARSSDLEGLGLPSDPEAIVRYLTHRYKGVGEKTAETLVERFGPELFTTLLDEPDAIARVLPAGRAEQLLEAWRADYERRTAVRGAGAAAGGAERESGRRGRGRGRPRGHARG
jgi:hypothetical protein